jgi:Holliday junction DNA helicase RuvA
MVLELRDKLPEPSETSIPAISNVSAAEEDVLSALVNLGYQRVAAEKALANTIKNSGIKSFDAMFRESLAGLSR